MTFVEVRKSHLQSVLPGRFSAKKTTCPNILVTRAQVPTKHIQKKSQC